MSSNAEAELPGDVLEAIHDGQTILAIKLLREQRRLDLKGAKETVDAYIERHPELLARRRANRKAASRVIKSVAILLVILYAAYRLMS